MNIGISADDFIYLSPVVLVTVWAAMVLLASSFGVGKSVRLAPMTVLGLVGGLALAVYSWATQPHSTVLFSGMMMTDRFSLFLDFLFISAGIVTAFVAQPYIEEHEFADSEFFAMLLLAIAGMMIMLHAAHFVTLVIGLETMSLAVYSLVGCWGDRRKSPEAGLKYFVMGAVASAILLYGFALLYGATGELTLAGVREKVPFVAEQPLFLVGMFFVLGAMAFKVALVPFHMWVPDAYEGAPTPVSGFMAAAVKAAGFGILIRIVTGMFDSPGVASGSTGWLYYFQGLAMVTMTFGNLAALRQSNIKRLLAYSSVSHAGYLLLGVVTVGVLPNEHGAVLFYLLSYGLTTMGAFAVVAWLGSKDAECEYLDDWAGLGRKHPAIALAMTIFLLSLGGMPPTAGFFAKFYLFKAALTEPKLLLLVVVAVVNSVISIFYYLRPVVDMYFRDATAETRPLRSFSLDAVLVISAALVLVLGLVPDKTLAWAGASFLGG